MQRATTKKPLATMLALAAIVLVAACAPREYTHGKRLDPVVLERVKPGVTRLAEVEAVFGKPSTTGAFDSGKIYYIAQHMTEPPAGRKATTKRTVVTFTYNAEGIITDVDVSEDDGGQVVYNLDAITPIPGDNFGVVDQIFGNFLRRGASAR